MAYTALHVTGLAFVVYCLVSFAKLIFDTLYTYAVGPVINKVNFKEQGKWACKCFHCKPNILVFYVNRCVRTRAACFLGTS